MFHDRCKIAEGEVILGDYTYKIICHHEVNTNRRHNIGYERLIEFSITNLTNSSVPAFTVADTAFAIGGSPDKRLRLTRLAMSVTLSDGDKPRLLFEGNGFTGEVVNGRQYRLRTRDIPNEVIKHKNLPQALKALYQALRFGKLEPVRNPENLRLNQEINSGVVAELADLLQIPRDRTWQIMESAALAVRA